MAKLYDEFKKLALKNPGLRFKSPLLAKLANVIRENPAINFIKAAQQIRGNLLTSWGNREIF